MKTTKRTIAAKTSMDTMAKTIVFKQRQQTASTREDNKDDDAFK